jgi:hypothetical protein
LYGNSSLEADGPSKWLVPHPWMNPDKTVKVQNLCKWIHYSFPLSLTIVSLTFLPLNAASKSCEKPQHVRST